MAIKVCGSNRMNLGTFSRILMKIFVSYAVDQRILPSLVRYLQVVETCHIKIDEDGASASWQGWQELSNRITYDTSY